MENKELDQIKDTLPNYSFIKIIGAGTYGQVWLIKENTTNNNYILKIIKTDSDYRKIIASREIGVLHYIKQICNPYLLCMSGFKMYDNFSLIILEYIKDSIDLKSFVREKFSDINIKMKIAIAGQLINGLRQMHYVKVVHRDIKPENILISENNARYIDFGFACREDNKNCLNRAVGTPYYMSPELTRDYNSGIKDITFERTVRDDIWALGMTLIDLFYDLDFWTETTPETLLSAISKTNENIIISKIDQLLVQYANKEPITDDIRDLNVIIYNCLIKRDIETAFNFISILNDKFKVD